MINKETKGCFGCKYREFEMFGECFCNKPNKDKYCDNVAEKGCKYRKRDIEMATPKGLYKYFELNDKQYVYKQGKFQELTNRGVVKL